MLAEGRYVALRVRAGAELVRAGAELVEVYVDRQINTLADTRYRFDSYCGQTLPSVCTKA